MAYLLVRHKVADFQKWKLVFDDNLEWRISHGEKSYQIFRDSNDPNDIFILCEWENLDSAKQFINSQDLKDKMHNAGVIAEPGLFILTETPE